MRFFFLLLVLAFPVQAEIYKWVDEKGKTHFGDRVPEKYQKKADNVEVNIRQPTEEEIAEAEKLNADLADSRKRMETSNRSTPRSSGTSSKKTKQYASEYDQKMAEYRESQRCYAGCQVRRPRNPDFGGSYIDSSACGHCTNVVKPRK